MIYTLAFIVILLGFLFLYKKLFHLSMILLVSWNSILVFFLIGTNEFKIFFPETVLVVLSIVGFTLFQDLLVKLDKNETEVDQG